MAVLTRREVDDGVKAMLRLFSKVELFPFFQSWLKRSKEGFNLHSEDLKLFCCPAMLSHFSPAPVKTDRAVRIQLTNQVKVNFIFNQSINQPKGYNESLRLIDWFNPLSEKLPHGDDFRVGRKSDRTPRDNTVIVDRVDSIA